MIKDGNFGSHEAVCLLSVSIVSQVFFTSPAMLARLAGPASWYLTLISAGVAAVGFLIIYALLKRFPGMNIVQINSLVLGKVLGFVFSAILALWLLFYAAIFIREFVEVLKTYVLKQSPLEYLLLLFMLAISVMAFYGLESIARFSKLIAYVLLFGLLLVLILSTQNFETSRLYPLLGYGLGSTLKNGALRSGVYGSVIFLAIFGGSFTTRIIRRSGLISLLISGVLISLSLLAFNLAFPYSVATEMASPMYELTALINYGRFFSRLDAAFVFFWFFGSMITAGITFFSAINVYCKVFEIPRIKPVILPFAIITYVLALIPSDMISVIKVWVQSSRNWSGYVYFGLPAVVLAVAAIRKKRGAVNEN